MLAMQEICDERRTTASRSTSSTARSSARTSCTSPSARFADRAPYVSDYTGMRIYYRSIQHRTRDWLTIRDYLWRWDTDWFWCSRAFGVQQPLVRSLCRAAGCAPTSTAGSSASTAATA